MKDWYAVKPKGNEDFPGLVEASSPEEAAGKYAAAMWGFDREVSVWSVGEGTWQGRRARRVALGQAPYVGPTLEPPGADKQDFRVTCAMWVSDD